MGQPKETEMYRSENEGKQRNDMGGSQEDSEALTKVEISCHQHSLVPWALRGQEREKESFICKLLKLNIQWFHIINQEILIMFHIVYPIL